jgi:S-adenosylmethionine decarboxylase proenzyme
VKHSMSQPGCSMGKHILLNLYECGNQTRLSNLSEYEDFIKHLLSENKAEVVSTVSHQFDGGFTHLALLTTSHCSIHTWPEWDSAAIDIFTCSDVVDCEEIVKGLSEYFDSLAHELDTVVR